MNQFKEKLRLIYLPFLLSTIGFVLFYSLLNWALVIKGNFISLKQDMVNIWVPFGLSVIPVFVWVRPRIKLLRFKNDRASSGYSTLVWLTIFATTTFTQHYLETATGKLTTLNNINQFNRTTATKYYSLKNVYVDKAHASLHATSSVSGKHNETLSYSIFVAMPLYENVSDTTGKKCNYWLGKEYSESISNRLSDAEKHEKYRAFADQTQNEFDTTNFGDFVYLERLLNTNDHEDYTTAIDKNIFLNSDQPVVFVAHHNSFAKRNGETFPWIFKAFGIGALAFFILLLFPSLDEEKIAKLNEGKEEESASASMKELLDMFIPRPGYYATPILIDLNVLVFFVMVFAGLGIISFKATDLLHWGANFRPSVAEGQWWRLLTNTFLHGGLMHIFANMIGLVFVGIFLEPAIGTRRFAVFYIATGILASIASIWWHTATVSVGASGAIFGMYGVFLALLLKKVFPAALNKAFLTSTLIFVGFNLAMGLAGGIDNAAHIGGLVSGFVIGLIIASTIKSEIEQKSQEEEPEDIEAEMYS